MEEHTNVYDYCESDGQDFCILICRRRDNSSLYFGSLLYFDRNIGEFSLKHFSDETEEGEIIRKSEEFIRNSLFPSFIKFGPRLPSSFLLEFSKKPHKGV